MNWGIVQLDPEEFDSFVDACLSKEPAVSPSILAGAQLLRDMREAKAAHDPSPVSTPTETQAFPYWLS